VFPLCIRLAYAAVGVKQRRIHRYFSFMRWLCVLCDRTLSLVTCMHVADCLRPPPSTFAVPSPFPSASDRATGL